jgi:hypothetical protein
MVEQICQIIRLAHREADLCKIASQAVSHWAGQRGLREVLAVLAEYGELF